MVRSMPASEALRYGFSAVLNRPLRLAAEVAWRWCAGAALAVLLFVAAAEYFGSMKLPHPLAGAGSHLLQLAAALIGGVLLLQSVAAAAGRNAVISSIFAEFPAVLPPGSKTSTAFLSLWWLYSCRTALAAVMGLALAGAWLVAVRLSAAPLHAPVPDAAGFLLVFCPLLLVIAPASALLYCTLSLAPVIAVSRRASARASVEKAVQLIYRYPLPLGFVGGVFVLLRVSLAAIAILVLLAAQSYSRAVMLGLAAATGVFYCLLSQCLFVCRLGACSMLVRIAELEEQPELRC